VILMLECVGFLDMEDINTNNIVGHGRYKYNSNMTVEISI